MIVPNEVKLEKPATPFNVQQVIKKLVDENQLIVFMKGNSMFPQCGFSAQVVEIFKRMGVEYKTFDALQDEVIRAEIKHFANWPTLPQVYYKQKFIGGCDIVTELYQNGELDKMLAA